MTIECGLSIVPFISKRVLPLPKNPDKGVYRKPRIKNWPEPEDATALFDLVFKVYPASKGVYYAVVQLELPLSETRTGYQTYTAGGKTRRAALRAVISVFETSAGYCRLKAFNGVYFRVRGEGMDEVYRGYL